MGVVFWPQQEQRQLPATLVTGPRQHSDTSLVIALYGGIELLRFDAVFENPLCYLTYLVGSNQPLYLNSNELIRFNKQANSCNGFVRNAQSIKQPAYFLALA